MLLTAAALPDGTRSQPERERASERLRQRKRGWRDEKQRAGVGGEAGGKREQLAFA